MRKKLWLGIYIVVCFFITMFIFYIAWIYAANNTLIRKTKEAAKNENYEFFLSFRQFYETTPFFEDTYTEIGYSPKEEPMNHTTEIVGYRTMSENDENSVYFFLTNLNSSIVVLDESDKTDDSLLIVKGDNGIKYEQPFNINHYDESPILLVEYSYDDLMENMSTTTNVNPTKITYLEIKDAFGQTLYLNDDLDIDIINPEITVWEQAVIDKTALEGFTAEKQADMFFFVYPESSVIWIVVGIFFLVFSGLGFFIFRPSKRVSRVVEKNEEAIEDIKEKRATRDSYFEKETEAREKRFKSVRKLDENGCIINEETSEKPAVEEAPAEAMDEEKAVDDELIVEEGNDDIIE